MKKSSFIGQQIAFTLKQVELRLLFKDCYLIPIFHAISPEFLSSRPCNHARHNDDSERN
jgi:hypothetical protein